MKSRVFLRLFAASLFFVGFLGYRLSEAERLISGGGYYLLAAFVSFCLLFPLTLGGPLLVLGLFLTAGLQWINETKIALTQMPLTLLDLRLAASNPAGLFRAIGLSPSGRIWAEAAAGIVLLLVAVLLAFAAWRIGRELVRSTGDSTARFARVLTAALLIAIPVSVSGFVRAYLSAVEQRQLDAYKPVLLSDLSRRFGVVPFLIYSEALERSARGNLFLELAGGSPPADEIVADSVRPYLKVATLDPAKKRPNIVILMGESTFNLNEQFALQPPVESPLYAAATDTVAFGNTRVNPVGGGTWISEFESITGLDARLFGYAGYYTHAAVAPYVSQSLTTYLRAKGYSSTAYYSWSGTFYSARFAYSKYGFDRFIDIDELQISGETDAELATAYVRRMEQASAGPAFNYLLLAENHAPHPCVNFTDQRQFTTQLSAPADFGTNCQLNEYVRRLRSTEKAAQIVKEYLQKEERETGRPYVLVFFGDHLPHTFVRTDETMPYDYSRYRRKGSSVNETFFHVWSSIAGVLTCCRSTIPLTLLPTLISAYVADGAGDLFNAVNFYLYERCGADPIQRELSYGLSLNIESEPAVAPVSDACAQALSAALASYRRQRLLTFDN